MLHGLCDPLRLVAVDKLGQKIWLVLGAVLHEK